MAKDIPYTPVFPYTGKQIIIDSDRVTLNSKEDKLQNKLGWSPETPFIYGIKETINWYIKNLKNE